jgi:glycosyltransferase involved in cell wall biosynthesis
VPNEEIPYLYKQSLALVMPTYFGPTNLPPLEAFSLDVPVLYSDKVGLRDQVGNAALLMDLCEPMSMACHLAELIETPELRERLVKNGRVLLTKYTDESRLSVLKMVLYDFRRRRVCWS